MVSDDNIVRTLITVMELSTHTNIVTLACVYTLYVYLYTSRKCTHVFVML